MIDSDRLIKCVWNSGNTPQDLAKYLNIPVSDLFTKIFVSKHFTDSEIKIVEKSLNLSKVDKELIFMV